jgi:hypothetical protein
MTSPRADQASTTARTSGRSVPSSASLRRERSPLGGDQLTEDAPRAAARCGAVSSASHAIAVR